jgi:nitrite reductase/ring-hydroxylating ferredoxin subunit
MPFFTIGSISAFPMGEMREVTVANEPYAICNVAGELHAIRGICPHQRGPLGQGALHGKMVVCPWHAWEFDCITGEHDYNPSIKVDKVKLIVEGDQVLLDLP